MSHRKQLTGRRVVHKSTGGILPSIPEPVDPVGNAAPLKSNTVAFQGLLVKVDANQVSFAA
jgi:hypothetical protein